MGEDVAWTAVALGDGDLWGWFVAGEESPQPGGGGVAGHGVGAAGQDRGGNEGLWVLTRWGEGVHARVAAGESARSQARVDRSFAEADPQQLGSRDVPGLPPGERPYRRLPRVLGYRRYVMMVISHYLLRASRAAEITPLPPAKPFSRAGTTAQTGLLPRG